MAKKRRITPKPNLKRGASPTSGIVPPAEHRWKPGQSGNPAGRPSIGASSKEWLSELNELVRTRKLTEAGLLKIAKDGKEEPAKRAAAASILRALEVVDPADYVGLCEGKESLKALRNRGVSTRVIKKVKTRQTYNAEMEETAIEREVEFHNRAGQELDRILDRTIGRPMQEIIAHHDGSIRDVSDGQAAADRLLAGLTERLGVAGGAAGGS